MQQRWRDLKSVKVLHYTSCFFGVSIPNLHDYNGLSLIYVLYAFSLTLFYAGNHFYFLSIKLEKFMKEASWNVYGPSTIVFVLTDLLYFFNVVSTLFLQRKRIVCLNAKLNDLEDELNRKFQSSFDYKDSILLLQILSTVTLLVPSFFFKHANYIQLVNVFKHRKLLISSELFVGHLHVLSMYALGFQFHFYSSRLRSTLRFLKKNMMKTIQPTKRTRAVKCSGEIVYCMRKYNEICGLIDEVSSTYRWQMFFMIFILSLETISGCNTMLKQLLGMKRQGKYSVMPILYDLACVMENMLLATIVASTSEHAINEAKRTLLVNYKILMKFPSHPKNLDDIATKEALMMFSEHIRMRKIEFSTGYFSINYSMLYTMWGFIVTNLIVILQFY